MPSIRHRLAQWALVGLAAVGATSQRANAGFTVSYEAAKVQKTSVTGATTMNFDTNPVGVYSNVNYTSSGFGTLTSPGIAIVAADSYGGAGGSGNYLAIGAESGTTSATLTFQGAQSYFGFWWSAADANNSLDLYSGGKLLGTLATSALLNSLGATYNGNPNYGNGNSKIGADSTEKFAYINIYGTNGTTIDQVVFRNAGTGTGFEVDNISIASSYGQVTGAIQPGGVVPEPSSITLMGIGLLFSGGAWLRNRNRTAANA